MNCTDGAFRARRAQTACRVNSLLPPAAFSLALVFSTLGATLQRPNQNSSSVTLSAGLILELRLETPVSSKVSHVHNTVLARVIREVPGGERVAIPLGALLRGRIEKLSPGSGPSDRARLLLRFTRLELPGHDPMTVAGRVKEVENARETTLADGTVEGLLESELPLGRLEAAIWKSEELQGIVAQTLGKSDTSIEYSVGTDFEWILDRPLTLNGEFDHAVRGELSEVTKAAMSQLLAQAPKRASSQEGAPGDPLNLALVGNPSEIRTAFQQAGWTEAEQKTSDAVWQTVRAVVAEKGYAAAPVSHLYLYGRPEDLAFEKMLNTFSRRHHLRLWRSPATAPDGREIWLGAATHDNGFEVRPHVISHAIDPDLDAERAKVGADLVVTGRVAAEKLLTRSDPLTDGLTTTGAPWKTDGKLLTIELNPEPNRTH